jgi:Repeat of unknown function (DUF5648)
VKLVPRHVRVCVTLLSVFAAALFSTSAGAFIPTCSLLGDTTFAPPRPQANDQLTFNIIVWHVTPPDDLVLTKTTYGPGNAITFDVVATPSEAMGMFPGYQADSVTDNGGTTLASGTFGPLPVGQYVSATSFRIYDSAMGFISPCPGVMNATLSVYDGDGLSPVIEYYNSNLDHYFITQSPVEIAALDAGVFSGWVRTGQSFLAYLPNQGFGASFPVLRYYGLPSAGLDTHFYTFDSGEIETLDPLFQSWKLETPDAFDLNQPVKDQSSPRTLGTCAPGEIPVYRLWNGRSDSDHRYTTDPAIKAAMIAKGYIAEGYGPDAVMMCAFTR